jgi:cysteine desulfurase
MTQQIYLDYAAATPVDSRVLDAMRPYYAEKFYNPSALYGAAHVVRQDVEAARAQVAGCLGARPAEIVFTAGGSEANNLAISGVMRHAPAASKLLVSPIEHDSVLKMAAQYSYEVMPVTEQGIIDVAALPSLVDDQTVLISCMYANNEIGTIQPIREIAAVIDTVRRDRRSRGVTLPLYLHVDAAQAANYLDLQVARLGADLLSLNGGKVYGPKQSGALFVKAGIVLEPLVYGGGQERGLRSGTENVPSIVGFGCALGLAQQMRHEESRRLHEIQRHFINEITEKLPDAVINGSRRHRLPNNIHLTIPGADNERIIFALDESGIQAAAGSACSASSETPSHVLSALGLSDEAARASLRFTMGRGTTVEQIDRVIAVLASLVH